MFAKDRPNAATIEAAAKEAGVDLAKAKAAIASGKYDTELETNIQLTQEVGLSGTPGWVIGKRAFTGAVGKDRLAESIAEARKS